MKKTTIGKYYVSMNEYNVISVGLNGGMVYYTYFPKTKAQANKLFKNLCEDVKVW